MKNLSKVMITLLTCVTFITSCRVNNNQVDSEDNSKIKIQSDSTNSFMWGVSTAGYQSEGYDTSSMWHFWDLSGKTKDHNPKGVDFFHKYKEDIQLAKDMGCNSFRFSIEWSRIEPKKGVIDQTAVQYYKDILKELKDREMTPIVTLIHFNYPQWVLNETKNKGLEDSKFIDYFLNYVIFTVKEFKGDVKYWLTFNEPNIWIPGAYLLAQTPPGKINPVATVKAGWNLLKAHSMAYDLIHGIEPEAMVSSNVFYILPKPFGHISKPDDVEILSQKLDDKNMLDTDWFFESINNGKTSVSLPVTASSNLSTKAATTPQTLEQEVKQEQKLRGLPITQNTIPTTNGDQVNISSDSQVKWLKKFDFVAFDYYYRFRTIGQVSNLVKPWLMESYPEGLYDAVMDYHKRYKKPIMIAENGMATEDNKPRADHWTREVSIVQHIKQLKRAMNDGANVIGYFHWSITDNYEWGSFTPRFGLYTVNPKTDPDMKRIPTPAVEVYKEIIKNNGVTPTLLSQYQAP